MHKREADDRAMAVSARRTLEELLDEARARIERLAPEEAYAAVEDGGILIDIRSEVARSRDGIVPGSLHIPRTVLEWRLAPDSAWRNSDAPGLDHRVMLLCDHGYSSILAAATLVQLGFARAGDVIGGFAAWREQGLPTVSAPKGGHPSDALPGMRPRDS
jgi:rhodanese-related sulfurtransferase